MSLRLVSFAALALAGAAVAQVPPPPPPPAASSSAARFVTSIGFDGLKAIFDEAGVAYEIKTFASGAPYLAASPEGYLMFASLSDCPDTAKAVDCAAVSLESGVWEHKLTADDLNAFNNNYMTAKAFLTKDGAPGITYSFRIGAGVSPTFIRTELKSFVGVMKYFGTWAWLPAPDAAAAPPAAGSFSTGADFGEKLLTSGISKPQANSVPTPR